MVHCVEEQFYKIDFAPAKFMVAQGCFVSQRFDGVPALIAAVLEISLKFGFRVYPIEQHERRIHLDQREGCRRLKSFLCTEQIEIEPKQRVISDIPEFLRLNTITLQRIRASDYGVIEHVDSCPKL